MRASVVDLRYKMREVLKALRHNEKVEILYHGKTAGIIFPVLPKLSSITKVKDHPFFGMSKASHSNKSVQNEMGKLRGGRFHDL